MKFEKLDSFDLKLNADVRMKTCGNVLEVAKMSSWGGTISIRKLTDELYVDLRTGEVKECTKIENRSQAKTTLKKTFSRLRDLINTNCTDLTRVRFVTFTYAENMQDRTRLYRDLDKVRKKARYQLGSFEYISVIEPQARGAWHSHEIWIFPEKAPFIESNWLASKWGNGFVSVRKIDSCDNLGAYLTAYLADIPLDEYLEGSKLDFQATLDIKDVEVQDVSGNLVTKKIVKGGRLVYYPPKMNIYRTSRGVLKPTVEFIKNYEVQKKIGSAQPTFKKAFKVIDEESNFERSISYEYYNLNRF